MQKRPFAASKWRTEENISYSIDKSSKMCSDNRPRKQVERISLQLFSRSDRIHCLTKQNTQIVNHPLSLIHFAFAIGSSILVWLAIFSAAKCVPVSELPVTIVLDVPTASVWRVL